MVNKEDMLKNKYSILFLSHERKMGGANCSMLELVKALKEQGHDVHVAVLFYGCPLDKKLKDAGIPTVSAFYGWWQRPEGWPFFMVWAFKLLHAMQLFPEKKLMKYIKNNNIQIIHSNASTIDSGCRISEKTGIPHVYHVREFGKEDFDLIYMYGREKSLKYLEKNADRVIFISRAVRQSYSDFDRENKKSVVIYNAVSDFIGDINKSDSENLTFLQTGTINPGKNQMLTLRAAKLLKDRGITGFKVLFAGEATSRSISKRYKQELLDYKRDNQLDNVVFLGRVEDMGKLRSKVNVEIVPSNREAFGRVTIEAMMAGIPVIASDTGANPELVDNEKNGLIFDLTNPETLADKMEYLMNNKEKIALMSENARTFAQNGFTLDRLVEDIENVYKGVIK